MTQLFAGERPRRVVVTGAAGAIGSAVVAEFKKHGHSVLGIDVVPTPSSLNVDVYIEMDLGRLNHLKREDRDDYLQPIRSWSEDGGLDVLVNNAAVQILGNLDSLDKEDWESSLDINLLAPFYLTKHLLNPLERVNGSVVNISSVHARHTKPQFVVYATTKAALSGLTRALAVDLGDRVRVNAVEPASIHTPMLEASFEGRPHEFEQLKSRHPQKRIGTPEEVAALVYAISLGNMNFLHGACIDLSGGLSARLNDPL